MFDLTLTLEEQEGAVEGSLEYRTDLFDGTTVRRWGRALERLLEALAAAPDQPLGAVSLLAPAETQQLLVEWNAAPDPTPGGESGGTVVERIFRQAERTPEAPALLAVGDDGRQTTWSYGELAHRAGRLARRLARHGVGPEVRVGLVADRSPETVVAILAIWANGGAYVPLEPTLPRERLEGMIDDALPRLILVRGEGEARSLRAAAGEVPLLDVEGELAAAIADEDDSAGGGKALPVWTPIDTAAAYMIYTSGSTGRPKGVVVSHRAVAGHARAIVERYGLTAADRIPRFASLGFDLAVEETFPLLTVGGTVVLPVGGLTVSFAELSQVLEPPVSPFSVCPPPTGMNGWRPWSASTPRHRPGCACCSSARSKPARIASPPGTACRSPRPLREAPGRGWSTPTDPRRPPSPPPPGGPLGGGTRASIRTTARSGCPSVAP
jgi:non-ribosomal peptide synthetase component F